MGCGASTDSIVDDESIKAESAITKQKRLNRMKHDFSGVNPEGHVEEMALTDYLQIERDIAEAEISNPLQPLDLKSEQLHQYTTQIEALESQVTVLKQETLKEKEDVDRLSGTTTNDSGDIKSTIMQYGKDFDEAMAKEKSEYIGALNRQEIAEKELKTAKKQKRILIKEVQDLTKRADHLQDLYKKQDKLLANIFGGEYGSLKENQIESELDHLETQRGRILEANFKWRQGQMMLEYACKQLAVAVQKWQDLPTIPVIELEMRYSVAAETRNNIVAASQNLTGTHRGMEHVEFPYCNQSEVETLNKAAQFIFTDMQSPERHEHANQCYTTTHKRANALLQWFDTVINTTIMKDLGEINDKVKEKTLELRRERVRLIKQKVEELYGKELKLDQTLRGRDITAEELSQAMMSGDNQVVKIFGNDESGDAGIGNPPLLSNDELAPIPNNSVIFGQMYENYTNQLQSLSQQHQEELNLFMQEQEQNQKKINMNLEEKLMARRQRRARMRVEEAQLQGMQKS